MAFFYEEASYSHAGAPLAGKLCGLIAVASYSNPEVIIQYLHDFCLLLKMKPIKLPSFPYLRSGSLGELENDAIFHPFERAKESTAAAQLRKKSRTPELGSAPNVADSIVVLVSPVFSNTRCMFPRSFKRGQYIRCHGTMQEILCSPY